MAKILQITGHIMVVEKRITDFLATKSMYQRATPQYAKTMHKLECRHWDPRTRAGPRPPPGPLVKPD